MFDLGLGDLHTLVTGASGGIGLATVDAFLSQDARVTAHYNSNASPLDEVVARGKGRVCAVQADLGVEADVDRLYEEAREKQGGRAVEVLVVNHAYIALNDAPLINMSLEQWNKTINTNLTGTFLAVRGFLRQLNYVPEANRDKIAVILIGSTAGLFGEAGHADYACSKSALMGGLLLSLKNEIVQIAPKGRVCSVAPGWVKTPAVEPLLSDPNVVYAALASTPLKKLAEPQDIARQVLALASSELSGHITGQVVMAHGGMEGRLLNQRSDLGLPEAK